MPPIPLFPIAASTFAGQVDALYLFLIALTIFFCGLIYGLIIYFTAKYRRRFEGEKPAAIHIDMRLEVLWTVIPLILVMISFAWGAAIFMNMSDAPDNAMEIRAVGRQWMWKFQHPGGAREINELHVPVGTPVKVILASEDVVHSFFVPAFRVKMDEVPGKYTALWFEATRGGVFHLFCAEYCGTLHAGMIGKLVALKPIDYQRWLSEKIADDPPAVAGERLFQQRGCAACHQTPATALGPSLVGLFGRRVELATGETVIADEEYVRESILNPRARLVNGYQPTMPTFQGQLSEEALHQIMAYLKLLGRDAEDRTSS